MLDLFRAEWKKVSRHFLLTSFTVWIVPVGVAAFLLIAILLSLLIDGGTLMIASMSSGDWTKDTMGVWLFFSSFPGNVLGRLLPMGFMATMFAGEYQWQTWKNVVPRSTRTNLIVTKFIVLISFVMLSLMITSALIGILMPIAHKVADLPYGPDLSLESVQAFLPDFLNNILIAFLALLMLAGFATLAAITTRSILGGLLAGFGLSVMDPISILGLILLGSIFNNPDLVNLYRYTSSYQLDNIRSWLFLGEPFGGVAEVFSSSFSLGQSFLAIGLWIIGLLILTIFVFRRSDIG